MSHDLRRFLPALLLALLLAGLVACSQDEPPVPEGPTVGALPVMAGAAPLGEEVPLSMRVMMQVHRETIQQPLIELFHSEEEIIEVMDWYDKQLRALDWSLVDVLQFGDGGYVRRYYRGQQRAILAFLPAGEGSDFMLMQGEIR